MTFQSINPTTGEPFATYEEWPTEKAQNIVAAGFTGITSPGAEPASTAALR
jgi:hypothetical protein